MSSLQLAFPLPEKQVANAREVFEVTQASFVWQEKRQKLVRGVAVLPPALGQPVALEKAKKDVGGVKAK